MAVIKRQEDLLKKVSEVSYKNVKAKYMLDFRRLFIRYL
jgi:hypothetical protein